MTATATLFATKEVIDELPVGFQITDDSSDWWIAHLSAGRSCYRPCGNGGCPDNTDGRGCLFAGQIFMRALHRNGNDIVLLSGEPQFAPVEGYTKIRDVILEYQTGQINTPTVSRWVSDIYGARLIFCICFVTETRSPTKKPQVCQGFPDVTEWTSFWTTLVDTVTVTPDPVGGHHASVPPGSFGR